MNSGKRKGKELSSPVHYKDPVGKPAINVAKKKKKKKKQQQQKRKKVHGITNK